MRQDILADLPRVRAAPMGWWFPMAFVVHAAAPGSVLFGLSVGGVIPTPWSYGGVVIGAFLAIAGGGALLGYGLKIKARIDAMRDASRGMAVHARVLQIEPRLGNFRSRNSSGTFRASKYALTLEVWLPDGQRYPSTQESYFQAQELAALQPGSPIHVHVDPRDPQTVFVPLQQPAQQHPPQRRGPAVGMWG